MNAVFADTYYFLALVNRKDQAHNKCVAFSNSSDRPLVTTTWVLLELGDALRRSRDRSVFKSLCDDLNNDPDTVVVPAEQQIFDNALSLFAGRADKEWSLTDCTSFVVMHERGIIEALTADRHFQQAGFTALLAD